MARVEDGSCHQQLLALAGHAAAFVRWASRQTQVCRARMARASLSDRSALRPLAPSPSGRLRARDLPHTRSLRTHKVSGAALQSLASGAMRGAPRHTGLSAVRNRPRRSPKGWPNQSFDHSIDKLSVRLRKHRWGPGARLDSGTGPNSCDRRQQSSGGVPRGLVQEERQPLTFLSTMVSTLRATWCSAGELS